ISYSGVGASLRDAGGWLQLAGYNLGEASLTKAGDELIEANGYMSAYYDSVWWWTSRIFDWIVENMDGDGEPYVLTWQKIVEVWYANDFEARTVTIACIDRMRQLIWDEPFNVIWAAKPEVSPWE
ncbi:unnamed protein product, partial [marine sediment metagenome]